MIYKARLTEQGARDLFKPHLAGKIIYYERIRPGTRVIENLYYQGKEIGKACPFPADCELITRPEEQTNGTLE